MSRSVSAPSSVTNTSPCWKGFMVPGSTLRYGSSFCMVTLRPRAVSNCPRLDAVSPLPSEEATPPVTKTCLVVRACKEAPRGVTVNPCALPLLLAPFVAGLPACRSTGFHANTESGARAQQTRRGSAGRDARRRALRVAGGTVAARLLVELFAQGKD